MYICVYMYTCLTEIQIIPYFTEMCGYGTAFINFPRVPHEKAAMNDQMMVGQQKQPYPGKANYHWQKKVVKAMAINGCNS